MKGISEREYNAQLKKIQIRNVSIQRRRALNSERRKYRWRPKIPATSKLMAAYLFLVLNVVLVYAMVAMWCLADLTYLGVLITDVAAQVLTYFIYTKKATAENTVGGITYSMALKSATETEDLSSMSSEDAAG